MAQEKFRQWEELIKKLPCVINADICCDEKEQINEIHILATKERSAKQIMRDIQSAITAQFKTELDYKMISIAQIPSGLELKKKEERLVFDSLNICLSGNECTAKVSIKCDEGYFTAEEAADNNRPARYRAIAQATAKALNSYLDEGAAVSIEEVRFTEAFGQSIVICALTYKDKNSSELLVGSSIDRDFSGSCSVRATLDAINRRIYK